MKLWIPGPTEVRDEIFAELARPMIGHRSQEMSDTIARIDPGLRLAFGLDDSSTSTVAVGTHSGTAMMEGSLFGVGQRVLCVVNGAFSKRWRDIALTLDKEVTTLELPWGSGATEETLSRTLAEHGPFHAVTLVVNETSTGARTPLEGVRRALVAHPNTLLLVDVVSALAGYAIDFDRHGIDFALAGVNKALALPPGICVMCASERYLDSARAQERRAWYLDPVRTIEGHVARKTPVTPNIGLYRALARQMEDISNGHGPSQAGAAERGAAAWRARYAKHERMQRATLDWAASRGLEPFPESDFQSPTVSCLKAGPIDVARLIEGLKREGHEIGNGYGPLKGETFRIGHMGDHTEADLAELLDAAERVLA